MRALQIKEPGIAEMVELPCPIPGPGEVLLKVYAISTCPHWDIHMMAGEPMLAGQVLDYPLTPGQPGHEMTGEVLECGEGVDGFSPGMRVAAWQDRGGSVAQGCYAQYVSFRATSLMPVSADLEPEQIASLELAMCVQVIFDQLELLDTIRSKRIGVGGLGPAGLIAVQMARAYGATEVLGIDPLSDRRAMGLSLGADSTFAPGDQMLPEGRFSDTSLDAAIDCTGLKSSIEYLIARSRKAVGIFGVLREDVVFPADCWRGGFSLMGYASHNRSAAEKAYQLIKDHHLNLAPLITHRLPLSRYQEGVDLLRQHAATKILFDPWMD
ncbi:MAG: zinc-binding dehydrogenase [Candidatus Latescibacteria bacterium]|nr:zinc-binding dehydrogenase [Candidatus Latescibacterota bacterium]